MRVTAWNNGGQTFGIRVGMTQRDRFFSRDWEEILIEMDGESHSFGITPGFWNQCPEIRDRGHPLIREWLARYRSLEWLRGHPPEMELVPIGGCKFRLLP